MRTLAEIQAMRKRANIEQLKAKDLALIGRADDHASEAKAFAQGVEDALIWAIGDIPDPFDSSP